MTAPFVPRPDALPGAPAPLRAGYARAPGAPGPASDAPGALGSVLLAQGAIDPSDLMRALRSQAASRAQLADVLVAHDLIAPAELVRGVARQWGIGAVDVAVHPPDPRLVDALGVVACLEAGVLPWRRAGGVTVVATAAPGLFPAQRPWLEQALGPVAPVAASLPDLQAALRRVRGRALAARAETRTPPAASCRGRPLRGLSVAATVLAAVVLVAAVLAPGALLALLAAWAVLTLVAMTALKVAAVTAALSRPPGLSEPAAPAIARMPVVSLLVALHGEPTVAPRLVQRLGRLAYPRELLDVMLIVEEDDSATRDALAEAALPGWIRVLPVPPGTLRTKPRALNFALDHCRGSIVGIYDAEDAPEPAQIHKVVRRFHARGAELACLQGVLDHYNARTNWLSRCFAVEYAVWFRLLLPGLERLGLPMPLGGTTVFFRRDALERLGAWDAHNVTEDADLGIRLSRAGLRVELLDTVTEEESTCRALPWIRQRSRWIKGYAVTYATHMRRPAALWRDLGAWRFLGVQVLFLGSLSHAILAPVLWSFWLVFLGLGHPLTASMAVPAAVTLGLLFVASEAVTIGTGLVAVSQHRRHHHLRRWVPTLHLYFPLASAAAAKALWELVTRPLYWDKTAHGCADADAPPPIRFPGGP